MAINFMRMTEDLWFDIKTVFLQRIDAAYNSGIDCYVTELKPEDITAVRNGGTDYFANAISYCHTKGLKFVIKISPFKWATDAATPGGSMEILRSTPAKLASLYFDFDWILQHYPSIDGLYLEEPFFDVGGIDAGASNRVFCNSLFETMKSKIVASGKDLNTYIWAFNSASNWNTQLYGLDAPRINSNKTFNTFIIQNTGTDASGTSITIFQSLINYWKGQMPNVYIVSVAFLTWDGLQKACDIKYGSHWSYPECFNQLFFEEVKMLNNSGQPVDIFTLYYVDTGGYQVPVTNWPNDTTAGTSISAKLKNIYIGYIPNPTTGTIKIDSIPQGAAISIDGGSFGITPRITTPISLSPGAHTVTLTLSGYQPLSYQIDIIAGTDWPTNTATLVPIGKPVPCGIIGDVDGDGLITQADVDLANNMLLSGNVLTPDQIKRIDVNGNGVADLGDLVLLKQFSLGQITTFPACTPVFACEQPLNGYEVDQFGNRRLNVACNAPCVSSGYVCEQPLNGYEKDNCGDRRLNAICNPPPITSTDPIGDLSKYHPNCGGFGPSSYISATKIKLVNGEFGDGLACAFSGVYQWNIGDVVYVSTANIVNPNFQVYDQINSITLGDVVTRISETQFKVTITKSGYGVVYLYGYNSPIFNYVGIFPEPPRPVASITLTPNPAVINVGDEIVITAMVIDYNSLAITGLPLVFTSDPAGIISTDPAQGATFTDGKLSTKVKGLSIGMTNLKATFENVIGSAIIDVNSNPCVSAWICEVPLNGYEKDGCGSRRLNPICNVPPPVPVDDKTEQVIFVAIAIGAALSKL